MIKKVFLGIFTVALAFVFIFNNAPSARAQDTSDYEFTLEEITVTAQKHEENQQDIAVAMETVSGEKMAEMGWNDVDEILSSISNVIINTNADGMRISLRGLADTDSLSRTSTHVSMPTVAVNVDGAFSTRSSTGQGLYDIERVEVLFGPQSTTYASSSPGGVVNVVTAAPKLEEFSISNSIEYGSYDLLKLQAVLNAPIVKDKFGMRLSFYDSRRDSYVSEKEVGDDTMSTRLKLLYQPNDKLSFTLSGIYSKVASAGMMGNNVAYFGYQDEVDDPWTLIEEDEAGENTNDTITKAVNADIAWETGIGTLTMVPSFNNSSSEGVITMVDPPNGNIDTFYDDRENEEKSVEVRMASPEDSFLKWLVSANYYKLYDQVDRTYESVLPQSDHSTNEEESKAIYGNVTYPVTDAFRVTGGYRHSWDTQKTLQVEVNKRGFATSLEDINTTYSASETEYSNPDTKLGVEYDLGENMMLYADRSTSFRLQYAGMASDPGEDAEYEVPPVEKLVAYTVGSKNRFLENKLQLNAAVFLYQYKNKSTSLSKSEAIYESGALNGYYDIDINVDGDYDDYATLSERATEYAEFRSYGADIQASWIITSKDKLDMSISYLNSKWSDLLFVFEEYPEFFSSEEYNGLDFDVYSPTWTIKASYEHNFNLPNGGVITLRPDGEYQSEYLLTWAESDLPLSYQEGSYIINLTGTYAHPDGRFTLSGYAENLFNYARKTSYSYLRMRINDPRTYGVVLSVKF